LPVLLGVVLVAPALARAQEPSEKMALAIVEKLIAGKFSEIVAQFSPEMAAAVPGPALEQAWDQLTATEGPVRGLGAPRTTWRDDVAVTVVAVQFQRTSFDIRMTIRAGRLAGLLIIPVGSHADSWHAPFY